MLSDMKIGIRLAVLLVVLLVLMAVIGATGLYASGQSSTALKAVYEDKLIPIMQLNEINSKNQQIHIAISSGVTQPELRTDHIRIINENRIATNKIWDAFTATHMTEEEKGLAAKFKDARGLFVDEGIKPVVAAMQTGNAETIKKIQVEHIRPLYASMKETLEGLISLYERELKKTNEDAETAFKTVRMISIALISASTAIGILLGISIIRGINRSVGDLRGAMIRMASDGDLNQRIKVHGVDEIGQAATAFNSLIDGFAYFIRKVINGTNTVSTTASQLAAASTQISRGSQTQRDLTASMVAAAEQITVSINSVVADTRNVRKQSEASLQQTQRGIQGITAMMGEIVRVQEAVSQIASSVNDFIDNIHEIAGMTKRVRDIADQTNLLALNAAMNSWWAGAS